VSEKSGEDQILLPASHGTPFEWKFNPEYSKCLGRVAKLCAMKFPESIIVDIGANVGDSAAIIRSHGISNKMLCIEGVKLFFDVLKENAERLGNIVPVNAFVGSSTHVSLGKLGVTKTGNAVVYEKPDHYKVASASAEQVSIEFMTMEDILESYMPNTIVKLLKTDIEGWDIPVLNSSLNFIAAHKPAIFLELQVCGIDEISMGVSWLDLWRNLDDLGYRKALYWHCSSDFLCMLDIADDWRITEDIHDYFRNRWGRLHADVCILHETDVDLAAAIYGMEKAHARQLRCNEASPF
jgi:FkbM family methyltransferase